VSGSRAGGFDGLRMTSAGGFDGLQGEHPRSIKSCFSGLFTFRGNEPLPDGHSCSRWANTRPRNLGTAGSIVGFPSAGKQGQKYDPKVV
jgi:hypothetical protein